MYYIYIIYIYVCIYIYIYISYISYSEEKGKSNNIFRKTFPHFAFTNRIILYNKTYAKITIEII